MYRPLYPIIDSERIFFFSDLVRWVLNSWQKPAGSFGTRTWWPAAIPLRLFRNHVSAVASSETFLNVFYSSTNYREQMRKKLPITFECDKTALTKTIPSSENTHKAHNSSYTCSLTVGLLHINTAKITQYNYLLYFRVCFEIVSLMRIFIN